ncbi:MAG: PaaI family thioesterase [Alphaproteobacteria bacterium]|nr:PaaI family thioesterase [Alphaproteobacteria bacterium]
MSKTEFQPADPEFAQRVRKSFSRQGIMDFMGASLPVIEPGYCEIHLPFKPQLSQQHGFFHGGVIGSIADSAAGYAGYSLMSRDAGVLTIEYKMNIEAPGDGELLIALGTVIKPGRTITVTKADVFAVKQGKRKLCATMLQTLAVRTGIPEFLG